MFQYSFQQLCKSLGLKYKQVQIINTYESAKWVGSDDVWPIAKGKSFIKRTTLFSNVKKSFI